MTLLLKQLVGSEGAETLCRRYRQAVEQDFDGNDVLVDLTEVHCELVRPSFCGVFLVVVIVVAFAEVFGGCDLKGKSSETDGKGCLRQVGAVLNTSNRILTVSTLGRRPATAAGVSTLALLSYVFSPNEPTLGGRRRCLPGFGDVVVGSHTR